MYRILFLLLLWGCTAPENYLENAAVETEGETVSNKFITSIVEDQYGYIWLGTARGLNRYNGNEFTQFTFNNDSVSLPANVVSVLLYDSKNRLWVGTATHGVALYENGQFKRIKSESSSTFTAQILEDKAGKIIVNSSNDICEYNPETGTLESKLTYFSKFPNPTVLNLDAVDANNRIWVATQNDISVYDSDFKLIKKLDIPAVKLIHSLYINSFGELWLSHSKGLTIVDTDAMELKPLPQKIANYPHFPVSGISHLFRYNQRGIILRTFQNELYHFDFVTHTLIHQSHKDFPFAAPDFEITTIFTDSRNNLWFGSTDKGFEIARKSEKIFNEKYLLENAFRGKSVMKIVQSKDRNLWILTSKDGIYKYTVDDGQVTKATLPHAGFGKSGNIFFDSRGYLWVNSGNDLFQCAVNHATITIIKSYKFEESMSSIAEDDNGNIWVAGYGEYIYYKKNDVFERKQFYEPGYNLTTGLTKLRSGQIAVSAFPRGVFLLNPNTLSTKDIEIPPLVNPFLPSKVFEDSNGQLWIPTHLKGLFCYSPSTRQIKKYFNHKMLSNDASGLIEDSQGYLWIPTQNGLSKLDPKTDKAVVFYSEDGTGGNQYNHNALARDHEGRLYFGGPHGITEINPLKAVPEQSNKVIIEKITSDKNKLFEISSQGAPAQSIELKNWNNSFNIHYTVLNYSQLKNYKYEYTLEGYNDDWIDAGKNRQANFYKIPPGTYTFKVRAVSNSQNESFETSMNLKLLPPWWASPLMMVLYVLVLMAMTYIAFRLYRSWRADKDKTLLAEKEKQEAIRINELNFNYFSNISHEFRTPLTMINGPVTMLANKKLDQDTLNLISIIQRNVDKMLGLVNQFLDFNNLKEGEFPLKTIYLDIIPEIRRTADFFAFSAKEKKIRLSVEIESEPIMLYLDRDKFDKILSNVLSNAIKYTPAGGRIEINVSIVNTDSTPGLFSHVTSTVEKLVRVDIKDTGIGIPRKDLKRVFERFYQVNHKNGLNHYGTGIGLNYSQRLIRAHHGDMEAFQNDTEGTTISMVLPLGDESYSPAEIIPESEEVMPDPSNPAIETHLNTKERILIVDDEPEITHFLKTILSSDFIVECVFKAEDAIKILENFEADLIISDILMPGMSGYDFCQYVKENIEYSHIPVLLLTAKSTTQEQVKGLYKGADAYIVKPFDPLYLIAVVKSQINNRKKIRELLTTTTTTKRMLSEAGISPHDKVLLNEFYALMNEELDNSDLNIVKMTERLNLSRTKFYYKIKSLTGENPASFFKTYKLNKAAEYIKTGQYNISEIAYMTGFNTLSHFSISFKKQFGVPPSEYK